MSFHPQMEYAPARFHRSERKLADEGEPFAYTPENQAKFDEIVTHYPPEQRKSAILYALYLAQSQQGYLTGAAMRHVAEQIRCTPAEVEDVVSYYTMFYTKPVGKYVLNVCRTLSCALLGAERVTEELSAKLGIKPGETDAGRHVHADGSGVPRRLRPRAGRDGERRLARAAGARAGGAVRRRHQGARPGGVHRLSPARGRSRQAELKAARA